MKITICGSLKFHDNLLVLEEKLKNLGHIVYMPVKAEGVDYWEKDGTARVAAKKGMDLISKHMDKIQKSDAILVCNYDKKDITNYVGANTFAEILMAHYFKKKIFFLNPIPAQDYISEELLSVDPVIVNGKLESID